uniref:Uncharacterized protein n=1 Tax=viral metagenome TaxID=1070528 RepID=A0A6C0K127_9ZZZZ
MSTGTGIFICKRETIPFRFEAINPLPVFTKKHCRSATIKDGELHLCLGNLYMMFSLEKKLIPSASNHAHKIWDRIMTNDMNVGYDPIGFDENNSFQFKIYLSNDEFKYCRFLMSITGE